ncbi:M23 family metallopeptidase [Sphingomonas sp. JC676]|uniref:M23 family metallopeptidase n=1 Tax=Sphingomonas sp. JC676 TaxID=2768065 RepID=UPI00165830EC|nr:M23 family metallopeptidase [Sphingomonas sp. JC676]MBC9031548.1 M23 family metallopeptidase [Sphingomonas sp. JC676]
MTLAKRVGWGLGLFLLVLAIAFASMVRIRFDPPAQAVREQSAAPGFADTSLIIPVQGVRANQLSDTWGQSRGGGTREHHAIDIMAPQGTPVLAAAGGTVEKIFESVNGGHTIYVRTPDGGTIHYYAHLDTYGVAEKQVVQQGQQIATVGNTGSAAGGAPHLHFEIKIMQPGEAWWQGTNVNPYPLLAGVR